MVHQVHFITSKEGKKNKRAMHGVGDQTQVNTWVRVMGMIFLWWSVKFLFSYPPRKVENRKRNNTNTKYIQVNVKYGWLYIYGQASLMPLNFIFFFHAHVFYIPLFTFPLIHHRSLFVTHISSVL